MSAIIGTDNINELTTNHGVIVDSLTIKDMVIGTTSNPLSNMNCIDEDLVPYQLNGLTKSNTRLRDYLSVLKYSVTIDVTSSVLNYTVTDTSGYNILIFDIGEKILIKSATTLVYDATLLAGTDASPNNVYIYVQNDGADVPELVGSNTYPVVDHVMISISLMGAISVSSFTDYTTTNIPRYPNRFLSNVITKFNDSGAKYVSGLIPTVNSTSVSIGTGVIKILFDNINISATGTGTGVTIISSTGTYSTITGIAFTQYSSGETITATRYFSVVFGVSGTRLYAIIQGKPTTEYYTADICVADIYDKSVLYYQSLKDTFIPICRCVLLKGSPNTIVQLISGLYYNDLRGISLYTSISKRNTASGSSTGDIPTWNTTYKSYLPKTTAEIKTQLDLTTTSDVSFHTLTLHDPTDIGSTWLYLDRPIANRPLGIEFSTNSTTEGSIFISSDSFMGIRNASDGTMLNIDLSTNKVHIVYNLYVGEFITSLSNAPRLHVNDTATSTSWKGHIAATGSTTGIIMGQLNTTAVVGGHSPGLDAWKNLGLNLGASGTAYTYVGNVYGVSGSSTQDVQIESSGRLVAVTSLTAHKINITAINDKDSITIYNIIPKQFNRRKTISVPNANDPMNDSVEYTNEYDTDLEMGFIAEDIEAVDPKLCIYDANSNLTGVKYQSINTLTTKELIRRNEGISVSDKFLVSMPYTYDNPITSSVQDLGIDSNGLIGYIPSTLDMKENILYDIDYSWVLKLKPVQFNYKGEKNIEYGLIAEDVEKINKDVCVYSSKGVLIGVNYRKLLTPVLSQMKILDAKNKELEERILKLESRFLI